MPEKHELSFEEFDARVEVEDDGRVWVSFHESSKCAFTLSASDLSLVAAFVEKHATSSWWIVSHSESAASTDREVNDLMMLAYEQGKDDAMDTNSPEFVSLLAAATWWRDYATNLTEGRREFPVSPYPALYEFTPAPPPGVVPQERAT